MSDPCLSCTLPICNERAKGCAYTNERYRTKNGLRLQVQLRDPELRAKQRANQIEGIKRRTADLNNWKKYDKRFRVSRVRDNRT